MTNYLHSRLYKKRWVYYLKQGKISCTHERFFVLGYDLQFRGKQVCYYSMFIKPKSIATTLCMIKFDN